MLLRRLTETLCNILIQLFQTSIHRSGIKFRSLKNVVKFLQVYIIYKFLSAAMQQAPAFLPFHKPAPMHGIQIEFFVEFGSFIIHICTV